VPADLAALTAAGVGVVVQAGAGRWAGFPDEAYGAAGADVVADTDAVLAGADLVLWVQAPPPDVAGALPEGAGTLSFLDPAADAEVLDVLAGRRADVLSFTLVPRTARAQPMDALTSQAVVSGHRAALEAAARCGAGFPELATGSGSTGPGQVLVLGAGIAGLQAMSTARRLGAAVAAYDVRSEARQDARSVGATFVELGPASPEGSGGYQRELSAPALRGLTDALEAQIGRFDAVIATAAVPGARPPVLVTERMVDAMGPGTVVVDTVADAGGNCAVSRAGTTVVRSGTAVVAMTNLPSLLPHLASTLLSGNVRSFLPLLGAPGRYAPDLTDEIVQGACIMRGGVRLRRPGGARTGVPPGRSGVPPRIQHPRVLDAVEVASYLAQARVVLIVPGFGLAVARAHHVARTLVDLLAARGTEVAFALHPLAGRLPGHLRGCLAEAGIGEERMVGVEEANRRMAVTDVVLAVGANDIVNPAAEGPVGSSPLAGMAVVRTDRAARAVFVVRGVADGTGVAVAPGYAGVGNDAFGAPGTAVLLGDAGARLTEIVAALATSQASVDGGPGR